MSSTEKTWIALVRAIGPLTHKKMSMAQLRKGCEGAGFKDVRTVLATGNVIFTSTLTEAEMGRSLAAIIDAHDLQNEVFLRKMRDLKSVLTKNPYPEASAERPNHMLVLFMSAMPTPSQIADTESFDGPERVKVIGREAYIDYKKGVAGSKLVPGRLEKLLGRSGTARNWNTIRKLVDEASN